MLDEQIQALVTPIARDYGVDVLKVTIGSGRATKKVQVFVDAKGGVDSDVLVRISRGLALQLDVEDLIAGKYMLEVTSPGLDWKMTKQADFDRYLGDWIRVSYDDGQTIEGENRGLKGHVFELRDEKGMLHSIDLLETFKVTRAINWKRLSKKKLS